MARKGTYWTRPGQSAATQGGRSGKAGRADTGTAGDRRSRAAAPRPGHRDAGAATGPRRRTRRVGAARADRAVVTRRRAFSHRDALQRVFMEKPPPIVEGHNLQPLHPADQQWVGTHQQQSPAQPVQQQQHHNGSMITDEIRFSIIDAVYLRPGIWDCQREKTVGPSRKELFVEVTNLINQQNQLDPELTPEEVEKQWKNLKDTYVKTRKKLSYNNDSIPVTPKWKFYSSLMFLDDLFSVHRTTPKRRLEEMSGASSQVAQHITWGHALLPLENASETRLGNRRNGRSLSQHPRTKSCSSLRMKENSMVSAKRIPPPPSEEAEDEDEYMAFCRSLLHPLREIAYKDRIQYLKVQKAIRDLLHDTQMDMLLTHMR